MPDSRADDFAPLDAGQGEDTDESGDCLSVAEPLSFGNVQVSETVEASVVIENSCDTRSFDITGILLVESDGDAFKFNGDGLAAQIESQGPITMGPGQEETLYVLFSPMEEASYSGLVEIHTSSESASSRSVSLEGEGI